jgi:Protein of unknown function (DUF3014)
MSDLEDFEIERNSEDGADPISSPGGPRDDFPIGLALAISLGVAAVVALGYFALRWPAPTQPSPAPAQAASEAPPTPAPEPTPEAATSPEAARTLPPLEESDGLVRRLLAPLSQDPQLALWLAEPGLIERFTAVVENIVAGGNPRTHLGFLAPRQRFAVTSRNGRLIPDPKAYRAYNTFAEAVESLDAAGCARAFERLEPLFDAAYRNLGHQHERFRPALAAALARLGQVPVLTEEPGLRPVARPILLYQYVDPRLEALSPAQKMLLRTGPRNVARLQRKLEEFRAALSLGPA